MLLNIFQNDAFSLASMTGAINKVEFVPGRIGQMGLFKADPIRTKLAAIEVSNGRIELIKTSQRGEGFESRDKRRKGTLKYFETKRLAVKDRITADDLAFLREFGTEDQIKQLAAEIARRQNADQNGLMADIDLTMEHMRLGAINGKLLDADGALLYDYFAEMGVSEPSVVNIDFSALTDGSLREWVQNNVIRHMRHKAKGARFSQVHALCGAAAFDKLHKNKEFRETFLNTQAAAELRGSYDQVATPFGGALWEEYIGTDDATLEIGDNEIKFVPGGNNSIFRHVMSPGEKFSHVGQLGQPWYSWLNWDNEDNDPAWLDIKVAAYPLMLNTRPEMVRKAAVTG